MHSTPVVTRSIFRRRVFTQRAMVFIFFAMTSKFFSLKIALRLACAGRPRRAALQRGFSLIEIMVVVVIMGVLAALVVPNVMDRPDQARVVAAKQDIGAIMQALKLYRLDHGRYPTNEQGLNALVSGQGKGSAYMDRIPTDPWNTPYQYLNPGVHGEIDVFSLGADRQPGGESVDADIGSWAR